MIHTTQSRYFIKKLPNVVREDMQRLLTARRQRAAATQNNLARYMDDLVNRALKLAPFIEDRYPFADRRHGAKHERLHHELLMRDEALHRLAQQLANDNQALLETFPEDDTPFLTVITAVYQAMAETLRGVHLRPPLSERTLPNDLDEREALLLIACKKMLSDAWLEKQLLWLRTQYLEYAQVTLERVGDKAHQHRYVSRLSFQAWKNKQQAAKRFIERTEVLDEETGEHFPLQDVIARTTANPENRRIEMMVRARGFQELAQDLDYTCLFITWTLPSRYHRNSPKWDGLSIKDGHQTLMHQWKLARARLAKAELPYFGVRVAEPHQDGTPHAHYFLFCAEADRDRLIATLQDVATTEDRHELGDDITPRFTVIASDPARGDAVAYMAKYIGKNINGAHLPESDAEQTAQRVRAWASTHRLHQFQHFGGKPVGLWRQLRRATADQTRFDPELDTLRQAADTSKWALFCQLAERATLAYETQPNVYGEAVHKTVGFTWAPASGAEPVLVTPCARTYRLINKAALDAALKARRAVPWSTENKCNRDLHHPHENAPSPFESALMKVTGWTQKGVQCLIRPLRRGATLTLDRHRRLSLQNGHLHVQGAKYVPPD
ncbi:replication endonuclease [Enterovibrio norvegicus]|uniref:replication endonuclease n=1 Tax=Enterovibrio norvegicus TaxID=188144 RepID=UPI0024B13A8C|nr:replication endonuclease [Enterovibrio norvegicus]